MALLTQKVIKEAFWKLLSEKSFSKITVKDNCGDMWNQP